MNRITLDFETRSACDLKKAGAFKYSLHPTTRPTCLSFMQKEVEHEDEKQVNLLKFDEINKPWRKLPLWFRNYWTFAIANKWEFSAHNAFFERCIYTNILVKRYGWPAIPYRQWRCTAAKAAACALPRSLEGAGEALNLTTQKDKRGYIAMMATCKPTKQWNAWTKARAKVLAGSRVAERTRKLAESPEPPQFLEPHMDPAMWDMLYRYCKKDTITEDLLDDTLPDLIPFEQEVWFLNQQINWRGVAVDVPTIQKIVDIMSIESKIKLKELDRLTMGLVTKPGARQSILDFLALDDIILPDIRAKTVEDVLREGKLSEDARRLLEIRQALSKTSTKKYQAFLDRVLPDGRIRDIILYHAASTGRDGGTGVQPQNFPRPVIFISKDRPYAAVEKVIKYSYEELKFLYGKSLPLVFSSILRNMLIPTPGKQLYVADFSKIEVAVLWWLANNDPGLEILHSGKDPYIYMAVANTGRSYEELEHEYEELKVEGPRQLGKAQVLGCGFSMGWKKFRDTADTMYRVKLTNKESVKAVKDYREANSAVCDLWAAYEEAAIQAIENRGVTFRAGKCKFKVSRGFLWVTLPSTRKLAYRKPYIVWKESEYEVLEVDEDTGTERIVTRTSRPKKTVAFYGLDKSKKKLVPETTFGGRLTENIVQAVARDLLKHGELELEREGYEMLLSVHDEPITERTKGDTIEFANILCRRPSWVDKNLPLEANAWVAPRYRK